MFISQILQLPDGGESTGSMGGGSFPTCAEQRCIFPNSKHFCLQRCTNSGARKAKHFVAILAIFQLLAIGVIAQTSDDQNEGTKFEYDSTNAIWHFKWWGRAGKTYFLQHSVDLQTWAYVPTIEPGDDSIKEWSFTSINSKSFWRLKSRIGPTSDPFKDDFDGDAVGNMDELLQGTDPLKAVLDTNGLPLDWEKFYGLSIGTDSAMLASRGDGMTILQAFQQRLNPNDYYNGAIPSETAPPAAPSNLRATRISDTQVKYEWEDNSNNERGFKIQRIDANGNWVVVATVGPNQTSAIVPTP